MFAFHGDMNSLLRYALIAVLIVIAIALASLCADGSGVGCSHACCKGVNRFRPLRRLARRLKLIHRSALNLLLLLLRGTPRGMTELCIPTVSIPPLLRFSVFRL